ncbi:DNA/RNA nuclease SfsA [Pseudoalteromonas sp. T1lg65]|uniref:DNA/RNA nuclease SfsA n=1 Tax=Pseudoalteromonas sp. T1lg65 TaxID=2077101 RepID=UPI003F7A64F4
MKFEPKLKKAKLLKRYKRFLADLETGDGETFTAHCANTGRMTGCAEPGFTGYFSTSDNVKRKYPHSLELTQNDKGELICVNTTVANKVAVEAIEEKRISQLNGYQSLATEVKYGNENSRIDILLSEPNDDSAKYCYVEVKSVTLLEQHQGYFPDAPSLRGQKHLRELIHIKQQGNRAVLLFVVLHTGIESVQPAAHIDPQYARLIIEAQQQGVEIYAYKAAISASKIAITEQIRFTAY